MILKINSNLYICWYNMSDANYYCGIGPVPKGKVRAPVEYCIQNNQVRYYGLVAIDPELLKTAKGKTSSLIKEQLKLKKIEIDAKMLIKEVKNLKVITDDDRMTESKQRKAKKRIKELLSKRDKIVKRLKDQQRLVESLERDEEEKERLSSESSKKSKSPRPKLKKSGSKTSKPKSSGSKKKSR